MKQIEEAIEHLSQGGFIVVADDLDRENEGDLIIAAEHCTPEKVGFMIRHTSGVICASLEEERLRKLNLPQMVARNEDLKGTAFTVTVDAAEGITTGISAGDRSKTLQLLANPHSTAEDFRRPGHIFPLRYAPGGVLKRAGHTEAALDLVRLAGCEPCGVIAEITNDDGSMARRDDLQSFCQEHNLPFITIADLVRYRRQRERLVERVSTAQLPTQHGTFTAHVYRSVLDGIEHLALQYGEVQKGCLVRVHSECLTGDILGSLRCDCGKQLHQALHMIAESGSGVLVYLRGHEGRGIGLGHKLRAYNLQDQGKDTVEANEELGLPVDSREYGIGAQILAHLGVGKMRLLTNNPAKYGGLEGYDLEVIERVGLTTEPTAENLHYLKTKQEKLGHLLNLT